MRRLGLIILLLAPAPVVGQGILRNAVDDLKHGALDVLWIWTSPGRIGTDDLPALAGVLGTSGVLMLADEGIQGWVRDHPGTAVVKAFQPFREDEPGEEIGDIWMYLRFSTASWLVGLVAGSETVREAAMGCIGSAVAQGIARRYVFYKAVERTRPGFTDDAFEFDVPGTQEWSGRSFPGGHAANAITCIAFWNTRYDLGWAEPLLYAAAVGVGLARVLDEAHWTSDTFAGLALGYAVGRNMAVRAGARARADSEEQSQGDGSGVGFAFMAVTISHALGAPDWLSPISMAPAPDGGLALTWRLRF